MLEGKVAVVTGSGGGIGREIAVMMALVAFLVPVFEGVFKQFGGELPKLTQVSVLMSEGDTQKLVTYPSGVLR